MRDWRKQNWPVLVGATNKIYHFELALLDRTGKSGAEFVRVNVDNQPG